MIGSRLLFSSVALLLSGSYYLCDVDPGTKSGAKEPIIVLPTTNSPSSGTFDEDPTATGDSSTVSFLPIGTVGSTVIVKAKTIFAVSPYFSIPVLATDVDYVAVASRSGFTGVASLRPAVFHTGTAVPPRPMLSSSNTFARPGNSISFSSQPGDLLSISVTLLPTASEAASWRGTSTTTVPPSGWNAPSLLSGPDPDYYLITGTVTRNNQVLPIQPFVQGVFDPFSPIDHS